MSEIERYKPYKGAAAGWGALIAVIWLGERLTLQGWLGGVLIVAAAWWVTRPRP